MSNRALIVLGHGSRAADAMTEFLRLVALVRERCPDDLVLPACMEMAKPSLHEAVAEAVNAGVGEIMVLSCFLFSGNHVKRDVPAMLDELRTVYPQVCLHMSLPIGPDARIAEILVERAMESCHV